MNNSPLPYTIEDLMVNCNSSIYTRERNREIVPKLEEKSGEFKKFFGIDLIFFLNPLAPFDYVKFIDTVLENVPDGISPNMLTASRYGSRAAELIVELIHVRSRNK